MTRDAPSDLFLILLSGDVTVTERLRRQIDGARVIAADRGMRHAGALGVTPELWVGDFDSADAHLQATWRTVERELHPAAKNATDGEIAVDAALRRGARSIVIAGPFGGARSDHAFSHLATGLALAEKGTEVMLTSGEEEAYPLIGAPLTLDLPAGSLFSVLAFTDVENLSIAGARYPLASHFAAFGDTRTISNVAEGPVTFSHAGGRAMVMARPFDRSGA
ncbi:thiamine diphosphokinase [Pararhizobium haloflavum]|uniref:thiamine diphosphokinase n=1 Tax=Pararhizobium haloflavum TaxID=2037914 RepID=UPI000C19CA20|nr:thiamine diphosphokinase [Pararhizobium haloflavum]